MKIAVLFGGDSMERDVSIASAAQVVEALRSRGHDVVVVVDAAEGPLAADREQAVLARAIGVRPPEPARRRGLPAVIAAPELGGAELVFLALHGGSGEDGTVQALLDLAGLPYTGTGKLGSALAWDKDVAKRLFRAAGVPTPDWHMAPVGVDAAAGLGLPVIVKPNGQGSTVGLSLVDAAGGIEAAVQAAARFDREVMLERYVPGRELTVGVLDGEPLAVGEIVSATGPIFDYEAKYQAGRAEEIFPADVPAALSRKVQALGVAVHEALKLDDYSRVDFRLDAAGELWCLEVNTLPGLSRGSLLPKSAAAAGIGFAELCERICTAALRRRGRR